MPDSYLVKPDGEFLHSILDEGGEDLKKCFQCATCSVVCELSTGRKPFPRKEMIWAQWGLKDKLMADPDVWQCYQCNDCSTQCPRGARPGDVLAALRKQSVQHYAVPQFLSSWVNNTKRFPLISWCPLCCWPWPSDYADPSRSSCPLASPTDFMPGSFLIGSSSVFILSSPAW